jgi:hypothetical protein
MKFLAIVFLGFLLWISVPHLQKLLLGVLVDQKVEQLTDDMKELVPSVGPELPLGSPELEEENNVAGEVALPSFN